MRFAYGPDSPRGLVPLAGALKISGQLSRAAESLQGAI
jgi:hypothetical protein